MIFKYFDYIWNNTLSPSITDSSCWVDMDIYSMIDNQSHEIKFDRRISI